MAYGKARMMGGELAQKRRRVKEKAAMTASKLLGFIQGGRRPATVLGGRR